MSLQDNPISPESVTRRSSAVGRCADKACAATKTPRAKKDTWRGNVCITLGFALYKSERYMGRAFDLLKAACDGSPKSAPKRQGLACNIAGAMFFDGDGREADIAAAVPLFEKACRLGSADGCSNAAGSYADGDEAPRKPERAKDLRGKACKLGREQDC